MKPQFSLYSYNLFGLKIGLNKALAAQWTYSYAINKDALLRKVVFAHNKDDLNSLLLVLGKSGNKSVLIGFVDRAIGRNGRAREAINNHFRVLIGDG